MHDIYNVLWKLNGMGIFKTIIARLQFLLMTYQAQKRLVFQ